MDYTVKRGWEKLIYRPIYFSLESKEKNNEKLIKSPLQKERFFDGTKNLTNQRFECFNASSAMFIRKFKSWLTQQHHFSRRQGRFVTCQ